MHLFRCGFKLSSNHRKWHYQTIFPTRVWTRHIKRSNVLMHYNGQTKNYTLKLDKEAESNLKMEIGVDLFTKSGWSVSAACLREQAINAGHRDSWILDIELKF